MYSRYGLINHTRGYDFEGYERAVDSPIRNLRHEIEADHHRPSIIQTVIGAGYRLALRADPTGVTAPETRPAVSFRPGRRPKRGTDVDGPLRVTDPTEGRVPGSFTTPAVRSTYDDLLARESIGEREALTVGQAVETADIDQLLAALDDVTASDAQRLYTHLIHASERHLDTFTAWLTP